MFTGCVDFRFGQQFLSQTMKPEDQAGTCEESDTRYCEIYSS